jgi:hypothetical protein
VSLADYYHEWAESPDADELREARALRAASRAVCPTCHEIGGHRNGCPACPEDDDELEAA